MGTIFVWIKKWYVALPLIVIVGFGAYWWFKSRTQQSLPTYKVQRANLKQTLTFSGQVEAGETESLHFQSGGRLVWLGVKEGDTVKKGQGIASLDQRQLQKTIEKYLNSYEIQRNTFDQTREDNDQLTIALSQEVRDRAQRIINSGQSSLDNTVLDVELQTIAKEYAYLISPIDGVVTQMDVKSPQTNITVTDTFTIVNPSTLYFALSADQTEVVNLVEGMQARVTLDSFPDEAIPAAVRSIAFTPQENETGTMYEVRMDIEPSAELYRVGMTGDAEFTLKERRDSISVPPEYVVEEKDTYFVYKMVEGKAKKVPVIVGDEYDEGREIRQGIKPGDEIVIPVK